MLSIALLLALRAAQAQEATSTDLAEEADLHFSLAIEAYRDGDYEQALEHLLLSHRLVPNRNVAFNIARTYEKLGRYDQAFRYYNDYVLLETDPAYRAEGEAALARISGRVALVHIESTPPGARVYVDRKDLGARGVTPLTLALSPGEHTLILELDGHKPAAAAATLTLGQRVDVQAPLDPILGAVVLDGSPAGAQVRLDSPEGPVVGTVPGELRLPPGRQILVIEAPGYRTAQEVVSVSPEAPLRVPVQLTLQTGSVVVDAVEQGALIEIDGEPVGFTPAVIDVPVGTHTLRVSMPGFRAVEQAVEVKADERQTLRVSLRSVAEVTAASRTLRTTEDAPASVSIITRDEIRAFGYQSVAEALSGQRGVYTTDDLSYVALGLRGFARPGDYGNRVLVTLDGHTLNDDQLGASYAGGGLITDLGDLERVEVVRGPGSALYGTSAFFGVVNLVTRGGVTTPGPHAAVTGDGLRNSRVRAGGGRGDEERGFVASAAGQLGQGGDWSFPELADTVSGGQVNDADGSRGASTHLKVWRGPLTVQAFGNTFTKRYPTGAYGTLPGDARATNSDTRAFAELRYEPRLGQWGHLYARAYVDHYRYAGNFPYEDNYLIEDRWVGTWAGAEPRLVADLGERLQLTVGAEARATLAVAFTGEDNVDGVYLDEAPQQVVLSGYALAEYNAGWLLATLGGRYDYFTLADVGGAFNPRATLIVKPNEDNIFKLMGGTAFRAPSAYELFYNDQGVSQIRPDALSPERIRTGELEYNHRFTDVITGTAALYYNNITGLVDTEVVDQSEEGEVFQYTNTDLPVHTAGAELELRRDWQRGMMLGVQASAQRTTAETPLTGERLSNSPALLVGLRAAAPFAIPGSTLSSRLRVESPRLTVQDTTTDWAVLWDLTLTGGLPGLPLGYAVGVRNLLDWEQAHPGGFDLVQAEIPQPGRTVFASLRWDVGAGRER